MRDIRTLTLAALLPFALVFSIAAAEPAQPHQGRHLRGHVPPIVHRLADRGALDRTNELRLAIGVQMHDPAGLDRFLADVYNPASPNFRQFLTPAELTSRFGPTELEYQAVKNFARTNGLTIVGEHGNRLLLDVRGPARAVERAFHVSLRTYRHPSEARDFFAPDKEPDVDASLPIIDVSGLESFTRPYPRARPASGVAMPHLGSAPDGHSYLGDDFRKAYVPGTTLDGSGQMVGLVQFEGYYTNDIKAYATLAGGGRTNIPVTDVHINGFSGTPNTNDVNGIAEVCLDIEMAMAMAPALSGIVVFEGSQTTFIPNNVLNAMAASNNIKNLSSSWGWSGGPSAATDNIFKTMAAQGQSYFNASGDSDAFPPGFVDSAANTTVPTSSPYVIQVGGTTLNTSGAGGPYSSETVWNWGFISQVNDYVGSSGGISTYYSIPAWQQGISSFLNNGGSTTARNIPDVSLTADNVYVKYLGTSGSFGGTSCAAPLWAGFLALINQQAALNGKPPVGFINPAVYEMANQNNYNSIFHDITVGNNTTATSPNAFFAVPNYDLCTGVGTPNGTNFIFALVNPDPLLVVSNGGFTAIQAAGGNFSISSSTFGVINAGVASLNWSLINTSAWLNISLTNGTLAPGATNTVTVSLNNTASNLVVGTYTANLWFTNEGSGVAHGRFFVLKTVDPLLILPTNNFLSLSLPGGPVNPPSQTFTLTNARAGTLNWGLGATSTWFTVSPAGGTLAGGAQTNVTLTTLPAATNLALGTYTGVLKITNLTSQVVQTVSNTLAVTTSLVFNGGFETGDFTSWTFSGTGYPANYVDSSSTFAPPHSGTYCALLGEASGLAFLSQTLPTVPNQKYLISIWIYNELNGSFFNPNELRLSWNGSTIYDKVNLPLVTTYSNLQFVVTATTSNTVFQIGARNDNDYIGLDDVVVFPGFPPAVATQPTNLTLLAGSNAVFTAAATGTTNLAYRWTKNGTNFAGAGITGTNAGTLILSGITTNSAASYAVVVTNRFGSITSSVATLTVVLPPTLASSSVTNRALQCGSNNATFTVNAAGTAPLFYQWSFDGSPVANATNTSFSVTNLSLPNHAVSVQITNAYASLATNATLTVQDTIAPAITLNGSDPVILELGGAFTDPGATAIDICAGTVGVVVTGSVNTNVVGTNTLIYKSGDGNANTNTVIRTVVIRDTTPPAILWSFTNLVMAANSNCLAPMPDVSGTNYLLASDLSGALIISQTPTNGALLLLGTNVVVITVQDVSSNSVSSTNTIVVQDLTPPVITLSGPDPLHVEYGQAFVDPGATAVDACEGVEPVIASGAVATNTPGTNTVTYTASDNSGNTNTATRTVFVTDTTPPAILWSFTNLVLAANSNCVAPVPDITSTNYILASDISGVALIAQDPSTNNAMLMGTHLFVITVSDIYGNTAYSTNSITVQDQTPPFILTQPQSQTNNAGDNASFTVAAAACSPLAYQWLFNQNSIPAHTNSTLTLSNLSLASAGDYSVIVSADGGAVTSSVAVLAVYVPPGISSVAANTNGSFTLGLVGSPGYTYVLEGTTNLLPPVFWLDLATNTLDTNGLWLFTDLQATNYNQQFYRLLQTP